MDLKIPKFDKLDASLEYEVTDFLSRWNSTPKIERTAQSHIDSDEDYSVEVFKQDIVNWIASGFDAQFYRMHTKIWGLTMAEVLGSLKYNSSDRLYQEFIKSDESMSAYQYKHEAYDERARDYVRWKNDTNPRLDFWTSSVAYPQLDVWSDKFKEECLGAFAHEDRHYVLKWFQNGFNVRYLKPLQMKYSKIDFTNKIIRNLQGLFREHGLPRIHPIYIVIYSIGHVYAMRHEMDVYYKRGQAFDELPEYKRRRSRALSKLYKVLIAKPPEEA